MDAIQLLTERASNGKLTEPGPDAETLALCFQAAVRAPDHGLVRPYRFFTIAGEARRQFGALLSEHTRAQDPAATANALENARGKAMRAPLIIVVAAVAVVHPKAPAIEQLLCAGAAAQNILLTLQARGFSGIWRTGGPAYDPQVKAAFGLAPNDAIIGFLYAGTASQAAPVIQRPDPGHYLSEWQGPVG